MSLENQLKQIKMLAFDVDGVLTDGGIIYDNQGNELKRFQVKDGQVFQILKESGIILVAITGRDSAVVRFRMKELKVDEHLHGVTDKLSVLKLLTARVGLEAHQVLYVGDDLPDIACIEWAGIGACPADAGLDVKALADMVCSKKGGDGVIRELAELLLSAQEKWESIVQRYRLQAQK
jgi:3-deoxy-D-manno-octulosonate 8-phosphate phosphatase (KDO 8-P phosphatase)